MLSKVRHYYLTISRLSSLQIYWRLRRLCLQRLWAYAPSIAAPQQLEIAVFPSLQNFGFTPPDHFKNEILSNARELMNGHFTFLNQTISFSNLQIDWAATPDNDLLWTYNLHYFEYAYDLIWAHQLTGESSYLQVLLKLIEQWIDENPFWQPVAWNPYPLSKRMLTWCAILPYLGQQPQVSAEKIAKICRSAVTQLSFLYRNPEYDVDNNHLITNAATLLRGGLVFRNLPDSQKWYDLGLSILEREAENQILPDGGHVERSSSYQIVVLQDFLETLLLQDTIDVQPSSVLEEACRSMSSFLINILRPNGTLPLLNDSVNDYPLPSSDILTLSAHVLRAPEFEHHAKRPLSPYIHWLLGKQINVSKCEKKQLSLPSASFATSGYSIIRSTRLYLLFDSGPIGPSHSAAHGHADALSFELSTADETLLIDPGVFEYPAGKWRNLFRGSTMHNTVTVDELDQSIFWGSFRVAEKADARLLNWQEDDTVAQVCGQHDGYRRLKDFITHQRCITFNKKEHALTIVDELSGLGTQLHDYDVWFHLGPTCLDVQLDGETAVCTFQHGTILQISMAVPQECRLTLQKSWYSPSWKTKFPIHCLRFSHRSSEAHVVLRSQITVTLEQEK